MKKILPHFLTFALVALIAGPASAQPASSKSQSVTPPGKFRFTWSWTQTPEIERAAERLKSVQQRFKTGNASQEEVSELQFMFEDAERRVPIHLTVESGSGPLSAFLAAASENTDRSFTLINAGDPADLETQLPPFVLRDVNWGTVIGVLDNLLLTRGLNLRFVGGDNHDPSLAKSVICVLRPTEMPQAARRSTQPEFESFQLADYISANQTLEVIVDAIRTAWELDPTHDATALRVKFHPATKILLVSGPSPATSIAKQVVSGLRKKTL